jgi:hypothetical protein
MINGNGKSIVYSYCGSSVIVPEELRGMAGGQRGGCNGKFEAICTINFPASQVPKPGTKLKVKYKKAADPIDDTSDYAIQINGQYVYMVLDTPDDLEGLLMV